MRYFMFDQTNHFHQTRVFQNGPSVQYVSYHGLRTPNEDINQRNLKFMAHVADKICFCCT